MFLVFLIVTYPTLRLGFKNTCAHTRALASLYNLFLGAILGHIKYASDYNLQPVINDSLHQPVVSLGSEQYISGNPTSIFPTTWRISKRQERFKKMRHAQIRIIPGPQATDLMGNHSRPIAKRLWHADTQIPAPSSASSDSGIKLCIAQQANTYRCEENLIESSRKISVARREEIT